MIVLTPTWTRVSPMNWTIRSKRRAPAALRTPTSMARRAARAVSRVTKLMAATSTIRAPTAAMA